MVAQHQSASILDDLRGLAVDVDLGVANPGVHHQSTDEIKIDIRQIVVVHAPPFDHTGHVDGQ